MANANPVLRRMREDEDGRLGEWVFAVETVLHFEGGESPSGFMPAAQPFKSDLEIEIADMFIHGQVTVDDLQFAARCLNRYVRWLRL